MDTAERFMNRLTKTPTCWIWKKPRGGKYGIFYAKGRSMGAHRWSYELFVGPIPEGLVVDHLCEVKACVNPNHLEVKTQAQNMAAYRKNHPHPRRTHCKEGHELYRPGDRRCWVCYENSLIPPVPTVPAPKVKPPVQVEPFVFMCPTRASMVF